MISPVLKTGIKWAWMLLVLVFVAVYAYSRHDLIAESLRRLGWLISLGAFLGITLAKFTLVENMRLAVRRAGARIPFRACFCIYNLTQLAKYVPGSIWQFVSRIAMLRERGLGTSTIRDSILAEHAWVLATALLFGVVFVLASDATWLTQRLDRVSAGQLWGAVVVVVAGLAIAVSAPGRRLMSWGWSLRPGVYAIGVLLVCWLLMGTAFWVTLLPFSGVPVSWLHAIGVYCLAYLLGFLVPFAPAGIGVREAVLVAGVGPLVGVDVAILLAAVNRILYLLAEAFLVIPCFLRRR